MSVTSVIWGVLSVLPVLPVPIWADWSQWWSYEGMSGPDFWSYQKSWKMCAIGRHQSPIDLDPLVVTMDSALASILVDKHPVSGTLKNTGQTLALYKAPASTTRSVNITSRSLAYRYEFQEMYLHWGQDGLSGSEHSVGQRFFPGELQILAFNADLYKNLSQAFGQPSGVVALAIMIKEAERGINSELSGLVKYAGKVKYRGQNYPIPSLNVAALMPSTDHYLTYDGSFTQPGCWEGVTWIVLNKPIYLSRNDFDLLRTLVQGEDRASPKSKLYPNVRPLQDLNGRSIRTNIDFSQQKDALTQPAEKECPDLANNSFFSANPQGGV